MKILSFFVVLLLYTNIACFVQSVPLHYSIDGRLEGVASRIIYLSFLSPSGESDSAEIRDGGFHFKGRLTEPSPVILSLVRNYVNKPQFIFFVGKGNHTVQLYKDCLNNGKANGSQVTHDYELLKRIEKPFNDKFDSALHLARDTSKAAQAEWRKIRTLTFKDKQAAQATFIKEHPSSPVAAWALQINFAYDASDRETFKELYKILSPSLYYTSYVVEMKEKLKRIEMFSIGKVAPNFTQNDSLGKPVSLTDFRGKYLLLDFWASWCVPCRAENPKIVKAFNAFKEKGFTVLSVSLDMPGKKNVWLEAINKDGLKWTHVSDLKFWDNAVAKQYGIESVPANLLLDPNGKIIATNLHGDELEKKLNEVIK